MRKIMRMKRLEIRTGRLPMLPVFMGGMLLGIILLNMVKGTLLQHSGMLDENTLYQMKYMTVDGMTLFCYVLRKRIGTMLLFALLSSTYLGLVVCGGTLFWYGMSAGSYLALLVLRYGLKGILFAVVSTFPQYLFYVPAYIALLVWGEELYRGIYEKKNRSGESVISLGIPRRILLLAGILVLTGLGCLTEGFINPGIMQSFLKIF